MKPDSDKPANPKYSVRLQVYVSGDDAPPRWIWLVALVALLLSSPLLGRLVEKLM